MSESLVVNIDNTYNNQYKLCSTAQIWNGKALVSEWQTEAPMELIHQGIDSVEPNVFEQIRIKKMLAKANDLFEPKKISIVSNK